MFFKCPTKNEMRCILFDTLFGTNAAPILLIDPDNDGAIVDVNTKAAEFYGYSRDELRQLHVWDINALGRSVLTVMREISSWSGGHYPQRFRHLLADGTIRDVQVYAGPIQLDGQRLLLCVIQDITEVLEAEQFNRLLLESVSVGVCGVDEAGAFTFVNPEAVRAFGAGHQSEIIKLGILRFLGADEQQADSEAQKILQAVRSGEASQGVECAMRRADGTPFPARLIVSPIRVGDLVKGAVLSFSDLSKERERENEVSDLMNSIPGVVFQAAMTVSGAVKPTYFNAAAAEFLGVPGGGNLTSMENLSGLLTRSEWIELRRSLRISARRLSPWEREFRIQKAGGEKWLLGRAETRKQLDGRVVFTGVLLDITERKLLEARLEEAALTDSLTGLKNRRFFEETLRTTAEQSPAVGRPYSLIVIDIDHFKLLNDRFGHDVGDDTLRYVAEVLLRQCRQADCVARWGGEEFAVLMPSSRIELAAALAEEIRVLVADGSASKVPVSVSLGVGEAQPGEEAGDFFRRVDAALYRAKANGRNRTELARARHRES